MYNENTTKLVKRGIYMKKNNDYYIMCVLIGIGIGSVFEVDPVTRVSIGSGMGVFIGGLIEHSNNEKAV
jgi:hypothetical protein